MNRIRNILIILCLFVLPVSAQPQADEEISEALLQQLATMVQDQTDSTRSTYDIDLADLKSKYQNAVVKIEFTSVYNKAEIKMNPTKSERYYSGEEPPHGSGFFISENEILTNAHVVDTARNGSIRVKSPATGNVEFKVEIVGVGNSETIDLALLRLPEYESVRFKKRSGLDQIPHFSFGDSNQVKQADPVAVFGYPQSSDELKLIQAKVTGRQYLKIGLGRFVGGHQFIEVGPGGVVQPGNSGGPALNRDGEVIGVPSRGSGWAFEQGWLIPSNIVLHFLGRIRSNEAGNKSLQLPRLGIQITENSSGTAVWTGAPEDLVIFELGVVVREVTEGSLADRWGLKPGDLIVGFANEQKGISCALDFEGYRVITGKMKNWPPDTEKECDPKVELAKLHLSEMILTSDIGDNISFWFIRDGKKGLQKIQRKMEYKEPVPLPHLGTFEKPQFELWGDFVAQDFNSFNALLFEVPPKEILKGGVLVTYVEPNSLASRRGMKPNHRSIFGFSFSERFEASTTWVIIDSVNDKPVKNLEEFQAALRKAEKAFEKEQKKATFDRSRMILLKERYVRIGFRTNTYEGRVLELKPAFPIDEALESRPDNMKQGT